MEVRWGSVMGVPANIVGIMNKIYFDANALAFLNAANITNPTQRAAINTLVVSLKNANIWSKFTAIWPMVGGTATTHSYNLVNPAQYQISFISTWNHSSTGATPTAVTSYANTNLNCNSVFTQNNNHIAFYSRSNTAAGSKSSMGAYQSSGGPPNPNLTLILKNAGGNAGAFNTNQTTASQYALSANTDSRGLYVNNKTSSAIGGLSIVKNGSILASNTAAITVNNYVSLNLYISAVSTNAGYFQVDDKECAFASAGLGFTSGELSTFYTIVQAYQTTLVRQV